MQSTMRASLAEFIGTFALIFIGAGSVAELGPGHITAVAFAHGLTIMAFACAYGDVSGCHINPAVTIGLATSGEFPARRVVSYVVAQLAGAIAAGFALLAIFGGPVNGLGATVIDTQRITEMGGFALEAIGTFFLVTIVLNSAVRGSAGRLAPFAIGMTVTICILMFGELTGGSINPARTLGPAVATGTYTGVGIYLAAQLLGGIVAGAAHQFLWTNAVRNSLRPVRNAVAAE